MLASATPNFGDFVDDMKKKHVRCICLDRLLLLCKNAADCACLAGLACVQQPDLEGANSRQQGRSYSHLPHTGRVQRTIHPMPT